MIDTYPEQRESSPAVKLLKMSLHGISLLGGSGGKKEISSSDVAAALAAVREHKGKLIKLSDRAYHFGLAKYLNDQDSLAWIELAAYMDAVDLALKNQWKFKPVVGMAILRQATRLVLVQHIDSSKLYQCHVCGGTGRNRQGQCKSCEGSGRKELSTRELARNIGTDHKNFTRVWKPRIAELSVMVGEYDNELLSHLYYQFKKSHSGVEEKS